MKKFFTTTLHSKGASVVAGLLMAGLVIWLGSSLQNAEAEFQTAPPLDVVSFITTGTNTLTSRIGSLTLGSAVPAAWFANDVYCITDEIRQENITSPNAKTCLDVSGEASFAKLWLDLPALTDSLRISTASQIAQGGVGGAGGDLGTSSAPLTLDDIDGDNDDSMLVSGLGHYAGGSFDPRDLSTQTNVCATEGGILITCGSGGLGGLPPENGSCGPAAGQSFSEPPQNGLCDAGNPGAVSTNEAGGTYNWTCFGAGGGVDVACQADIAQSQQNTYTWYIGDFGQCQGAEAGFCSGSWTTETTTYIPTGTATFTGQSCTGEDGGVGENCQTAPNMFCHVNKEYECDYTTETDTTTHSCNGPTNQSSCIDQNPACLWTPPTTGIKTRTVVCKDQNGDIVDDNYCIPPEKPTTTEAC